MAMLAKQVSRITSDSDSLVAQVLKSKYYPNLDILSAGGLGNAPSYCWRSIHSSIDYIKKGGIRQIGNGENTNIWTDKWLPNQPGFKILTQKPDDCSLNWVSDLVKEGTTSGDHNLINHIFLPIDREIRF
jgi:hypothetical protein